MGGEDVVGVAATSFRSDEWAGHAALRVRPLGGVAEAAWVISAASAICASLLARQDSARVNGSLGRENTNRPLHGEGTRRVDASSVLWLE